MRKWLRKSRAARAHVREGRLAGDAAPGLRPPLASHHLAALQQALTNHRLVHLHYQAAEAALTSRLVEPFALMLSTEVN